MADKNWVNVKAINRKCPICGKPDWCMISVDQKAVICNRISDGCVRHLPSGASLHLLSGSSVYRKLPLIPDKQLPSGQQSNIDWKKVLESYFVEIDSLSQLSDELGVSIKSLVLLGCGKTPKGGWSFPMRDANERVIGCMVRGAFGRARGRKWCYKGSRLGLFIPFGIKDQIAKLILGGIDHPLLFITEGASDTASAIDVGYPAVGRHNCSHGNEMIAEFVRGLPVKVVVMADSDGPGLLGANSLCRHLKGICRSVVVHPPFAKDIRSWVQAVGKETVRIQLDQMGWKDEEI